MDILLSILLDERGGLGITRASLCSSIAEMTGDESIDAAVKINRLINEQGPLFCGLTTWPFLRSDISFTLSTTTHIHSGASYLPTTFKKVLGAYLLDGTDRYPLTEVSIKKSYEWPNPADNTGRSNEFCITRIESGYWEIQFNRVADGTYVVYMDIELQWADVASASAETLITKEYYPAFTHFVGMARFIQQGDLESYTIAEKRWFNPLAPQGTILGTILSALIGPMKKKGIKIDPSYTNPLFSHKSDYDVRRVL